MRFIISGLGYVGLSLATMLAADHEVIAVDVDAGRVDAVNRGICPFKDGMIPERLARCGERLRATCDPAAYASEHIDFVIIAVPTNYDPESGGFDMRAVEGVLDAMRDAGQAAPAVIKSTVPTGFTRSARASRPCMDILFSPEFLRESKALYDNLHPSRIVVGACMDDPSSVANAERFAAVLRDASEKPDARIFVMDSTSAEAVKLFSNTYLAMRVAYFNELDNYAMARGLDSRGIISAVCADPRIGDHYNNPSFGYGGYCLPKDTKQLLADYGHVPGMLAGAVVESNALRKDFIAADIMASAPKDAGRPPRVGIYKLSMKSGSDNFRCSAVMDVMLELGRLGADIAVFEPALGDIDTFMGHTVFQDMHAFAEWCDVIVANRMDEVLAETRETTIYTRDLFARD